MPDFARAGLPDRQRRSRGDDVLLPARTGGQFRLPLAAARCSRTTATTSSRSATSSQWMAGIAEAKGVLVVTETPGRAAAASRTAASPACAPATRASTSTGEHKPNYQPGADCRAKATVLCEGPRGTLAKVLETHARPHRRARTPQVYATGVKELWEVPAGPRAEGPRHPHHGLPAPDRHLRRRLHLRHGRHALGGRLRHRARLATIPPTIRTATSSASRRTRCVRALLAGGKPVAYGAKAIPEGGWWAMPKLSADGLLLCGDTGGFLNGARLKGIHLAIKSGMLAAETLFECLLPGDFSKERLAGYERRVERSWAADELRAVRNFHQGFEHGLLRRHAQRRRRRWCSAAATCCCATGCTNHAGPRAHAQARATRHPGGKPAPLKFDGTLTFDKLADVYLSGTHARRGPAGAPAWSPTPACARRSAASEYGNPCQHFCPANVYEMVPDEAKPGALQAADQRLELRALQDLRHRRPVPDHHLGDARGRRRPGLQEALAPAPPRRGAIAPPPRPTRTSARSAARSRPSPIPATPR